MLSVTSFGLFLILISQTSVTVALPALSAHFGASADVADWFLVAFMLAGTAPILIFGRLSDMLGRKRIYLSGMFAFMVASVLAALAPSVELFITARVLQGISAATIVANTSALIADVFPAPRLAHAISINLTAVGVCNTAGPAIGGLLISGFGWQSLFLVNLPFGILAFVLGLRFLPPRPVSTGTPERFDTAGAVLSAVAVLLILYAVSRGSDGGHATVIIGAAGAVALLAFVVVETKVAHPLVDLALVRDVRRSCAYGAVFFVGFAWTGGALMVALQQQIVAQRNPAEAGVVVTVMALAMIVATPVAGRMASVWSPRTLSTIGGGLIAAGLFSLALTSARTSLVVAASALVLVGIGIGLFTAPNTTAIMETVPPGRRTVANAVRSVMFNTAQAVSTALTLAVVAGSGIASYAVHSAEPAVVRGFSLAFLLCAVAAVIGAFFGVARGGPWRAASTS